MSFYERQKQLQKTRVDFTKLYRQFMVMSDAGAAADDDEEGNYILDKTLTQSNLVDNALFMLASSVIDFNKAETEERTLEGDKALVASVSQRLSREAKAFADTADDAFDPRSRETVVSRARIVAFALRMVSERFAKLAHKE